MSYPRRAWPPLAASILSTSLLPLPAYAQDADRVQVQGQRTAAPSAEPVQVLRGEALQRRVAPTLGATLQYEPGVANASFGPNVGLPVIRGQSGPRVGVTVGGTGTHDASTFSADHAVMTEPLLATRATVWRGPAAVRFGGGAIGGAVELENARIPQQLPESPQLAATVMGGPNIVAGVASATGSTGAFAWYADAHGRQQGDVPIPGWALDSAALEQQFGLVTARNTYGYIANTNSRSDGGSLGGSWVGPQGWLGASLSTFRMDYGIPPGGHSHAVSIPGVIETADEQVRIDAQQTRLDLRGEFDLAWPAASLLQLNGSLSDYGHDETDNGRVVTTFENRAAELRAELTHRLLRPLLGAGAAEGTLGLHAERSDVSALGLEVFMPKTLGQSAALFGVQGWRSGDWLLEAGARIEYVDYVPQRYQVVRDGALLLKIPPDRRFQPFSLSLATTRRWDDGSATLTAWSAQRAPAMQELYADGPHLATRTYDIGNPNLQLEKLLGLNLGAQQLLQDITLQGNVYGYRSDSYIYLRSLGRFYNADTGGIRFECVRLEICLPVMRYEQAPATLAGFELGASRPWVVQGLAQGQVRLEADLVRGRLDDGQNLPNLPPARLSLTVEAQRAAWSGEARLVHGFAQRWPGENQTPTAAYTQLNVALRYAPPPQGDRAWSVFLSANNITNAEIRNSASLLRNYAPEPGRVVQLGLQVQL
ncbi:MAG: TonB-dependent receptor [Burkholderiales bacterium]|nr:TonB-dependent receptor [Burkholderiales bacterium]